MFISYHEREGSICRILHLAYDYYRLGLKQQKPWFIESIGRLNSRFLPSITSPYRSYVTPSKNLGSSKKRILRFVIPICAINSNQYFIRQLREISFTGLSENLKMMGMKFIGR